MLGALGQYSEKSAYLEVVLQRVTQRQFGMDLVAIPPADSFMRKVAGLLELGDNPLCCALGDRNLFCHITQAHIRVLGDAKQHMGVVREEGPAVRSSHGDIIRYQKRESRYRGPSSASVAGSSPNSAMIRASIATMSRTAALGSRTSRT